MTVIHGIRCDNPQCNTTDTLSSINDEKWIRLTYHGQEDNHYCSHACLVQALVARPAENGNHQEIAIDENGLSYKIQVPNVLAFRKAEVTMSHYHGAWHLFTMIGDSQVEYLPGDATVKHLLGEWDKERSAKDGEKGC